MIIKNIRPSGLIGGETYPVIVPTDSLGKRQQWLSDNGYHINNSNEGFTARYSDTLTGAPIPFANLEKIFPDYFIAPKRDGNIIFTRRSHSK